MAVSSTGMHLVTYFILNSRNRENRENYWNADYNIIASFENTAKNCTANKNIWSYKIMNQHFAIKTYMWWSVCTALIDN